MCMFCVIQKWSRRIATMLPWLVIPLIGLWALSQFLPPAFRFEITSPRLACMFVLLVTLFWYEVLMPQLSAWRVKRNALLRERKRFEALELQKMKKTATRKCRNCLTPYRDQNPGGGKFMCSYCGHISKRPILDLPIPSGMSNSGLIRDLLGKGGKMLNGNIWSDNVSLCHQEWLENGNWVINGSFPVTSSFSSRKNGVGLFGGSEPYLTGKSYSGVYFFSCKLLMSFLLSIRWLWRKLFRISSLEDSLSDADHRMLAKKGENASPESRSEKARRKAEEKRQARLEKEHLEEEERKQREEVAKLVEERRKLQDEKIEAENRARGTSSLRAKDSKKEAERKRQERRKENDKGSSKSNSDVDELDRKPGKENERKLDIQRRFENDQRESPNNYNSESGHGVKGTSPNNYNRGNVGSRYFDRVRGSFLSSSKAFSGSGFFGNAAPTSNPSSKEVKPGSSVDYSLFPNNRRDFHPVERLPVNNGDDKVNIRPVSADTPCKTSQMSWHQLFTRASPGNSNGISRPSAKLQPEGQSSHIPCPVLFPPLYDNPIDLPSPFTFPPLSSEPLDPLFPSTSNRPHNLLPEEPELFEDPCYEPDPVSLLGPVSESLDNFQLDRGGSFVQDKFGSLTTISCHPDISRPSPIESPLSRLRVADQKLNNSSHFSGSPKALNLNSVPATDLNCNNDLGTWHMWNSSPLGSDGLSLVGSTANWIAPLEKNKLNNEELMHSPNKIKASLFSKDGHIVSGTQSSQNFFVENVKNRFGFGASIPCSNGQDPWLNKAFLPPLSTSESLIPISPTEEASQKQMAYWRLKTDAVKHADDPSTASCWSKNDWSLRCSGEGVKSTSTVRSPVVGGLYSAPDVQSLWSFE